MNSLPNEQLINGVAYSPDSAINFLPTYIYQLHGGVGPRPKAQRVVDSQPAPAEIRKSRFDRQMDKARQRRNQRQRGAMV